MKKIVNWNDVDEKYGWAAGARATLIEELQFHSLRDISTETGLAVNTLRRIVSRENVTWDSIGRLSSWARKQHAKFHPNWI